MAAADHWLWRLDAHGWIAAARTELDHGRGRSSARRTALTHARRAGGMAINGVLVAWGDTHPDGPSAVEVVWGRSYQDHLRVVSEAEGELLGPLPPDASSHARRVLRPAIAAAPLVQLQPRAGDDVEQALQAAERLTDLCEETIAALGAAVV